MSVRYYAVPIQGTEGCGRNVAPLDNAGLGYAPYLNHPYLCQRNILLWDTLLRDILLWLYISTNSLHNPLTKSFRNTLRKKDVNKYF